MKSFMKMVKSTLIKLIFYFFCNQIFLLDLEPYENFYFSKPSGTVKETLIRLSDNKWKISSEGKHPLFNIKQESTFFINDGNVVLESGYRNLDILGGIRKDHQSYKIEKNNNKMFVNFSSGKNDGSIEIFDNFYDNLTLQVQIKLNFLEKDKVEINYFDKGKIKKKTFLNQKTKILYKSVTTEVYEFTEQRNDKRFFRFMIKNDPKKETLRVSQGGRGFNVEWELN